MAHDACLFVALCVAFGLFALILISTVIICCFYTSLYRGTSLCLYVDVFYVFVLCVMSSRHGTRPTDARQWSSPGRDWPISSG